MDIERLHAIGKDMGLAGAALREWVDAERATERDVHAQALDDQRVIIEIEERRLQVEKRILQLKLKLQEQATGLNVRDSGLPVSGLKLIEEERKRVEAVRLAELAAAKQDSEERKQLQEKELKMLREELHALKMEQSETETKRESRRVFVAELHDMRKMPEKVGRCDSARDGVEKLTTEEPLM